MEPSARVSPSHQSFNSQSRPRWSAHPYATDRHPAHARHSPSPQHRGGEGSFNGAHNFVMYNPVLSDNTYSDDFMSELLKETIHGAAFDDSDRDPPPRCHPGTRLTIVNQTRQFIANCNGRRKMLWIVGPAGVGKSAIMQTTAETTSAATTGANLGASIFFSTKGRSDGSKIIITLAYQLAANHAPYRRFVQNEIKNNPSLLHKSMTVQFNKFIVEPFIWRLQAPPRFLILIDGLDECDSHHTQCELLGLISYFCIIYPTSPLVWVVASRPEPHITAFFSRVKVIPAYKKEEIKVDSNEACEDVERFLRHELKKIQMKSPALKGLSQWPTERDIWTVTDASKGLFAYASTVVKFVDDPSYGDPASQLEQVLDVIDTNSKWLVEGKSHPMALLDALYNRILSRIPADVMVNTRKVLLLMIGDFGILTDVSSCKDGSMSAMCNWLGMTKNTAYGATYNLRSVLDVPEPDEADLCALRCFHKSFTDYLVDFERSKFCSDIKSATAELNSPCTRRILEEAPNGPLYYGPGTTFDISLSWPRDENMDNHSMKTGLYRYAASQTVRGLIDNIPGFQDKSFIRALTAFGKLTLNYADDIRLLLFDESRRSQFMEHGVLRQLPIGMINSYDIDELICIGYLFKCPATAMATIPNPWDPSCKHGRSGQYEKGQDQDWTSHFGLMTDRCGCSNRFFYHLESVKECSPDDLVTVFIS